MEVQQLRFLAPSPGHFTAPVMGVAWYMFSTGARHPVIAVHLPAREEIVYATAPARGFPHTVTRFRSLAFWPKYGLPTPVFGNLQYILDPFDQVKVLDEHGEGLLWTWEQAEKYLKENEV